MIAGPGAGEPPTAEQSGSAGDLEPPNYVLKLYITGLTPRSQQALLNIQRFCREHLPSYELEVIDIYQQPELARGAQIVAAPTLIKTLPLPLRTLVGDFSRTDRVLVGLGLTTCDPGATPTDH